MANALNQYPNQNSLSTLVPGNVPQQGGWQPGGYERFQSMIAPVAETALAFAPGSGEVMAGQQSREQFQDALEKFKAKDYKGGSLDAVASLMSGLGVLPGVSGAVLLPNSLKKFGANVVKNPTLQELKLLQQEAKLERAQYGGTGGGVDLRYLLETPSMDTYFWDGTKSVHDAMAKKLELSPGYRKEYVTKDTNVDDLHDELTYLKEYFNK